MPAFKPFNRRLMLPGRARYTLFDSFSVDAAAGAVNGTFSDKSHSERTVTDTENKLSISGGKLVFAGGKAAPAWGDPGIWYPAEARVAGKVLLLSFNTGISLTTTMVGFDTDTAGVPGAAALYFATNNIYFYENAAGAIVGVNAENTAYQFAIALRTAGAYYFIKGGAFTYWTLLWQGKTNSGASLRPGLMHNNSAFTADEPRVSKRTWLPEPLAYDAFTRGDAALGVSDIVGPDSQAVVSRAWSFPAGTWAISTNKAVGTPTQGAELNSGVLVVGTWYSITATEANHFYVGSAIGDTFLAAADTALDANNKVKAITLATMIATVDDGATTDVMKDATVAAFTAKTQAGACICVDSAVTPTKGIYADFDGAGNVKCLEQTAALTWTQLITAVKAYTAGDTLRIDKVGTAIRLYHITAAGVATLIGTATATANANTKHGIWSTSSGNTFSKSQVFPKGSGNEHAALDSL